jgi:hypothetical protein
MFLYDNGLHKLLKDRIEAGFFFTKLGEKGERIEIPSSKFNSLIHYAELPIAKLVKSDITDNVLISSGEEGFFITGPKISLTKGRYTVLFSYRSTGENPGYAIFHQKPKSEPIKLSLENTNNQWQEISTIIEIGKDMGKIAGNRYNAGIMEFSVYHNGEGEIALGSMTIERNN